MKAPVRKRIIVSMFKKEFAQVLRDPRMRGVLFGAPLLMLLIFGYAVNTDVNGIRLALLDNDRTAMSRGLVEKFTASGYFMLHSYLRSDKELERLMNSSKVEAYLHIEKGLSKKIQSGGISQLQLVIDGSDSNRAAIISAYVNGIVQDYFFNTYFDRVKMNVLVKAMNAPGAAAAGFTMSKGVRVNERAFFNPALLSKNFFLPGIIGLIVSMITIMLTSMSIVKERESGTMEQIVVSPIKPMEFIIGKTVPFAIIGFADMLLVTLISIFWFGVPFMGSMLFLFLAGGFYILSTLSVGIYISTISRTQQQAMMSFFMFFIPAMLFSGFVFPIYSMPETIQYMTYINPLRYFITIIRGVFLKGIGITVLWFELIMLVGIGMVMITLSVRRLSRRLE
jgi:ABC-2 type transport system permease protein